MFCLQVEVNIDVEAKLTLQGVAAPCYLLVCSILGPHTLYFQRIGVLMSGFQ